mgnify:CR=1 FL=1
MLKTVYFEKSPMLYILLFFIFGILICNLNGFSAVKNSICFYLPIAILLCIYGILMLAMEKGDIREKFYNILHYLYMGILGSIGYYVVLQIMLKIQKTEIRWKLQILLHACGKIDPNHSICPKKSEL